MDIVLQYWWQLLLLALACYVIGSINFAVIFSRAIKKQDIRKTGSGNAGTTNMFRVFGLPMGALTLLCDCAKGVISCVLALCCFAHLGSQAVIVAQYIAGTAAVIGHIFSVFCRLKGGKGFATTIGVILFNKPILMLIVIAVLLVIILITDRMSIAALSVAIFLPFWYWFVLLDALGIVPCICVTIISLMVIIAHRENIVRILHGKELPTGVRREVFHKKKDDNE